MTLLLGPPSSGKTTLLLAMAGKLDRSLKVITMKFKFSIQTLNIWLKLKCRIYIYYELNEFEQVEGDITYNGYKLNEFEPRRTSAYISQNDVHVGEMTVKETLDFSARCQGVGSKLGNAFLNLETKYHMINY